MNINALRHPRTRWEIEAAMWKAIELSAKASMSVVVAFSASGNELLRVIHDRAVLGGFRFRAGDEDVTRLVLKLLQEERK